MKRAWEQFRNWGRSLDRKQVLKGGAAIAAFIIASVLIYIFAGEPIVRWVQNPAAFRAWVQAHGWVGRLAFIGMMALQVIVAIIPGEPFEIAAGYAFGIWEGSLLCLLGAVLGSCVVFAFVRTLGIRVVEIFFPREKIDGLKILKNEKKLNLLAFIAFLIPGTPKDILTYAVGLTKMRFRTWLLITTVARIPSIITSSIGGNALGVQRYAFAIGTFAVTLVISGIGVLIYRRMNE